MTLRQLLAEEDGVSPVIGVILMVAITVILAAVAGSFVLGLGQQDTDTPPQVTIEFEEGSSSGTVVLTHKSGDTFDGSQVTLEGPGSNSEDEPFGTGDVEAGDDTGEIATFASGDEIKLVWESPSSDTTQVLAEGTVP